MKDDISKPVVIVIGLDGASWNILSPLIEQGKLPFFKEILMKSAYGPLESIKPPMSVPAWKCYSTGKDPSDLGVYTFIKLDLKANRYDVVNSMDFDDRDIWDYLGLYGYTSCVYKMFSTHPTRKIHGIMISDLPINTKGFYPRQLKSEIEKRFGSLWIDFEYTTNREKTYYNALEGTKKDFEVMKYILKKYSPNFVHISIYHTDGIQHFFWKDMTDGKNKYSKFIENAWITITEYIEDFIGYLKELYKDDFYLFFISDHGFTSVNYRFNMGKWLLERKYITLKPIGKLYGFIQKFLSVDRLYKLIELFLKVATKLRIKRFTWGIQFQLASATLGKVIDFKRSKIIPLEGSILYVNRAHFRTRKERDLFVSKVIEELKSIRTPDGSKLAKDVIDGHKLYKNKKRHVPDILIVPNSVDLNNSVLTKYLWSKPPENKWTGMHDLYGIIIVKGPNIKKQYKLDNVRIIDVAPTILHIFGIPKPTSMRGRVIEEIFENYDQSKKFSQKPQSFEQILIKQKIKSLKKLGVL
ncbi:MAG: alkaline phosphatase family protein [Candidatus Asgardarchaeia archaeon]